MASKANANPSSASSSSPRQARSLFSLSFMDSTGSSRPLAPSPAHRATDTSGGGSMASDSSFMLDSSPAQAKKTTSTPAGPSVASCKPGLPFLLKPRTAGITSVTSSSDRGRSRKRSANSISASSLSAKQLFVEERPSVTTSSVGNDDETAVSTPASTRGTSEVRSLAHLSPGRVDSAAFTFQNLSLRSPRPPAAGASSPVLAFGSSFSRYVASPAESVQNPDPFENSPNLQRRASPMSSMSSPKIAPLTVLTHESKNTTPTNRPPRHSGMAALMHSLDRDTGNADDLSPETPKRPPSMVHCCALSDTSVLDVLESPMKKQACADGVETPTSRASNVPLPRINLTPRSNASRSSRICLTPRSSTSQNFGLPRFPSPSPMQSPPVPRYLFDSQECPSSESNRPQKIAISGGNYSSSHRDAMPKDSHESSSSLALSVDSPRQSRNAESPEGKGYFIPMSRSLTRQAHPNLSNLRSQSLLHPPNNETDMRALLESERIACGDDAVNDNESLSDPDDEPFVLASPAAIGQEKLARAQQSKHRKLEMNFANALTSSTHPSSSSLLGTDFLSASNLRGMDREHQGKWASSSRVPPSLARTESSHSIGLALDQAQSTGEDVPRDLITPPIMEAASSPPPLSPRQDPYGPSKHHTHTANDDHHHSVHGAAHKMVRKECHNRGPLDADCS